MENCSKELKISSKNFSNEWNIPAPVKNEKFNACHLEEKWNSEDIGLIEFSVHTKFSTLDGVSSPADYVGASQEKKYKALVVTDHNNVQSFPEFWDSKNVNNNLKIVYGCEFEMIENEFNNFLINDNKNTLSKKIDDLTYCIFDLETTGLFSAYDDIIDFGYVIVKGKDTLEEKSFLIKPRSQVSEAIYKLTGIDKEDLDLASYLEQVLPEIYNNWKENNVDVLVSHNAIRFDVPFLNKAWIKVFNDILPYSVIDTLPLSWIVFPGKKSYSLEKLSQGRSKIKQSHRALEDSLLLKNLFEKVVKIAKENNFRLWEAFKSLIKEKFYNRGTKILALAKNKEGLSDLYKLVKISNVDNFLKVPFLFRSDVEKNRKNLLIGASGNPDGEVFSLFSTFNLGSNFEKRLKFYDYIEVRGLDSFSHYLDSSRINEIDLKSILFSIINCSKKLGIEIVASNNVHYCDNIQKKVKEIIVANEGINGSRHNLYQYAISESSPDGFKSLPNQHLRSKSEIIKNWEFLQNETLIEEVVIRNPERIVKKIKDFNIFEKHIGYPSSRSNENELMSFCLQRVKKIFGEKTKTHPSVDRRIQREWKIIKKNYLSVYWFSWKVVMKAYQDGTIVGSRGSVGCSFIAYLLRITDINPLPLYSICRNCKSYKEVFLSTEERNTSCYDFGEEKKCEFCKQGYLKFEGHSLPFETFVGWNGEKVPDIDLNFSGEYQRYAHEFLRELIGKNHVYRIGTVNKLSQQTAENFWDGYQKLRKLIDKNFNLRSWLKDLLELNKFKDVWEIKDFIIQQLKGIKRTTGQHPGGLLVIPPKINILNFTPLNYPADDTSSEWLTTHFEYSFLSKIFLKLDILGHDEPTILQKLFAVTGKDPLNENDVNFNDKKVMDVFTNCDALGIPEFGTELVKKRFLKPTKPTKFSELVQISGFSHGTNVWLQNQEIVYKEKKLALEKLLACREDILNLLDSRGIDNETAFYVTEFIRKGKWEKISPEVKNQLKGKLNDEEGKIYFSILQKIKYIFPKPHAIAYTMTAWRVAYYKVYFPEDFYSVLLTYHASVYDVWLMTLDEKNIIFRLNALAQTFDSLKVSKKEFISISKVLIKLGKEDENVKNLTDIIFGRDESYYEKLKVNKTSQIDEIRASFLLLSKKLENELEKKKCQNGVSLKSQEVLKHRIEALEVAYQTLVDPLKKINYDKKLIVNQKIKDSSIMKDLSDWRLTMKEKDLLFTLRVISEIKKKGIGFLIGVDFNNSDVKDFRFIEGKMLIPFLAIISIGESLANRIIEYRNKNNKIANWKIDLKDILNKKNFQQLLDLEENGLIF